MLAAAVARALNCRALHAVEYDDQRFTWACRWRFVGTGASAEIAIYAWAVLYRQLRRQRLAYIDAALRRCKPARKRERADIFCEGWAYAVFRKVEALKPERAQADLIDRYLATQGHELVELKSRKAFSGTISGARADDYWRGCAAGAKADLKAGVSGGAKRTAALARPESPTG